MILHVYASLEEHNISLDENYMCPLFVASNAYLPHRSAMASLATSSGPHAHAHLPCHPYQSEDMLCRIPVCTTEDIQDCAVHRIALYSAPTWIVPST